MGTCQSVTGCFGKRPPYVEGLSACAPMSPGSGPGRNQVTFVIDRATKSKVLAMEGPPKQKRLAERIDVELADLRIVSLKGLGLIELPENCLRNSFATLRTLRVMNNQLKEIPSFFREFKNLQTLDLSYNAIASVDMDFSIFPANVQSLSLKRNQLKGRITGLEHLVSLVELDLSENKGITSIDSVDWQRLVSMEELNLDNLSLSSLPSSLGSLVRLQVLSVRNNFLKATASSIPPELLQNATRLHTLHLEGNEGLTETLFMTLAGAEAYLRRRKSRIDKQIAGGTFSPDLAVI